MTRAALAVLLACATLAVGLFTARVANANHARAEQLDRLQRECEELEAIRARRAARARAHVPGELDAQPDEESDLAGDGAVAGAEPARTGA